MITVSQIKYRSISKNTETKGKKVESLRNSQFRSEVSGEYAAPVRCQAPVSSAEGEWESASLLLNGLQCHFPTSYKRDFSPPG